jgi:hypothetical protein
MDANTSKQSNVGAAVTGGAPGIARLAIASCRSFLRLVAGGSLHRPPERLGRAYRVDDDATYQIFRETVSEAAPPTDPAVLVVGFRLKVIGSRALPHWLFQRGCLLTTPFWSGFPGFAVKLWMVDPDTKNYLGIYDWRGEPNAQRYVDTLVRVLKPLSTEGSVWYRLLPNQPLEAYLSDHAVSSESDLPTHQSVNQKRILSRRQA